MVAPVSINPKGALFGKICRAYIMGGGDPLQAHAYAMGQGPGWYGAAQELKGAVSEMGSADDGVLTTATAWDLAEFLRPMTIVGRMVGFRRVPFNSKVILQTAGLAAGWVGEATPKPAGALAVDAGTTLGWCKVASISVHTTELARSSHPGVEQVLAGDAARAAAYAIDSAFVDPTNTGNPGIKPASITSAGTEVPSTGSAVANIDADLDDCVAALTDNDIDLGSAYWIMRARTAAFLARARGTAGARAYPDISVRGGSLLGIPVLISNAVVDEGSPGEASIILVAASEVLLADDGQARIELSSQASIQMDDAPSAGAQQLTSMWQAGLIALRCERTVNFQLRRAEACAYISGVTY